MIRQRYDFDDDDDYDHHPCHKGLDDKAKRYEINQHVLGPVEASFKHGTLERDGSTADDCLNLNLFRDMIA